MSAYFRADLVLRVALAMVLLSHSLHGIFTGNDVHDFGALFLNQVGFAPFGVALAWLVVITQIVSALLLLWGRFIRICAVWNGLILLTGIALVHFREGWFVVGGGRNGMEFSVVLMAILVFLFLERKDWR
ncbi:MAG: DoxX family protein [Chitinophagales bacterium]